MNRVKILEQVLSSQSLVTPAWRSRRCRCCLESQRLLTGSFNFAMNDHANVLKQFISKQVSTTKIAQKDG